LPFSVPSFSREKFDDWQWNGICSHLSSSNQIQYWTVISKQLELIETFSMAPTNLRLMTRVLESAASILMQKASICLVLFTSNDYH
jgi:hypothetical protein